MRRSVSFVEYEKHHNSFIKKLRGDDFSYVIKSIIKQKASLFVPQNVSLDGIDIDETFAYYHSYLINPNDPNQFITLNGFFGLFCARGNIIEVHLVGKAKEKMDDLVLLFESFKAAYTNFSIKQSTPVTIMRNGELRLNVGRIGFLVISERLSYTKFGASGNEAKSSKINISSQHRKIFLRNLRKNRGLYMTLKEFVNKFQSNPPPLRDQPDTIVGFVEEYIEKIQEYDPWKAISDEELDLIMEALEKYIMTLLFSICFSPTLEDNRKDKELFKRVNSLQFIEPKHLDIVPSFVNDELINASIEQLRKINEYKAPKDKLVCILNCCTIIYTILNKAYLSGEPAGADEFLPILIYVTLKANPPQLHSNILYISNFRNPNKMSTELGYYFTHLLSTVAFIENLNASKLTISEDEFNSKMKIQTVEPMKVNIKKKVINSLEVQPTPPDISLLHIDTLDSLEESNNTITSNNNAQDLLSLSYGDFFSPQSLK